MCALHLLKVLHLLQLSFCNKKCATKKDRMPYLWDPSGKILLQPANGEKMVEEKSFLETQSEEFVKHSVSFIWQEI